MRVQQKHKLKIAELGNETYSQDQEILIYDNLSDVLIFVSMLESCFFLIQRQT